MISQNTDPADTTAGGQLKQDDRDALDQMHKRRSSTASASATANGGKGSNE
jgi:hypothetical protein